MKAIKIELSTDYLFVKYLTLFVVLITLVGANTKAWAIPADAGPYKVGYQEVVFIDTTRDTNQINKPGEPNGRRLVTSLYYPIDDSAAQSGIPVIYKLEWASDINPSGTLPLSTVQALAGNLTYPSEYGALVDSISVLPPNSSTVNCNVVNCTDGNIVGLPVSTKGPFPLIISVVPGVGSSKEAVSAEFLASHGFIVAAPSQMGVRYVDLFRGSCATAINGQRPCNTLAAGYRAIDISFVITSMLSKNSNGADPFNGTINADKIGAMGYSAGVTALTPIAGGNTFGSLVVPKDPRVKAFAAGGIGGYLTQPPLIPPQNFTIPTLWYKGTADPRPTAVDAYNLLDTRTVKNKYLVQILGKTHVAFGFVCSQSQGVLNLQKNNTMQPSDKFYFTLYMNFDGVKSGGLQTFCASSLFYEPSNNAALAAIMAPQLLSNILLPANQIPGFVNSSNVYAPTVLGSTSSTLINKYVLAFFKVYLTGDTTYKSNLIPGKAHAQEPGIIMDRCDQTSDILAVCRSSVQGNNTIINDMSNPAAEE